MDPVYIDIHIHTSENPNHLNDNYNSALLLKKVRKLARTNPVLLSLTDHNGLVSFK